MKYDFTSIIDRHGRDSIAVDRPVYPGFAPEGETKPGFDDLPMWVADMNFATVPTIPEAIIERAKHPLYGYFQPPKEYFDAIIRWQETRNKVSGLTAECIGYENGVLGGVVSALNVLCSKGDNVLLHSPTYIGFTMSLKNNGYNIIHTPLKLDEQGIWRMDYADMDAKIKQHKIHTAIFCSPHNPCGRVWEREEIEQAMEVYRANDVYVISDEIWSDILLNGHKHIPTQSVSEDAKQRTVAIYAPSKTFNLAGLIGSYHIIYNQYIRERILKEASLSHYNGMNVLSMHALMGAYKPEGYEWVDELNQVLSQNVNYAYDYITKHFEGVRLAKPEGTYMLFLDCTQWCEKHGKTIDELQRAGVEVGVIWQDGRMFHGACSIRMNLALPHARVVEALERLNRYVFNKGEKEVERLKVGDIMPDFTFNTPFTQGRSLAEAVGDKKTALVFLRYYGCTLCQLDLAEYKEEHARITEAGGQLYVVLQSDPILLAEEMGSADAYPYEIICDPKGELYARFGILPAESKVKMAGAGTLVKIAKAKAAGHKHGRYEGEELQLPAAFVLDGNRKVLYAHYAKTVDDIPDAEKLAAEMK